MRVLPAACSSVLPIRVLRGVCMDGEFFGRALIRVFKILHPSAAMLKT